MCVVCTNGDDVVEFPSVAEYIAHEKGGHVTRPVKVLPPSVDRGPSATEMAAALPADEASPAAPSQPQKAEENVESMQVAPLKLEYKWTGICKVCLTEVKTIIVDIDAKVMVVAYCIPCDKKLEQETVIPIEQQIRPKYLLVPKGTKIIGDEFEKNVRPKKK